MIGTINKCHINQFWIQMNEQSDFKHDYKSSSQEKLGINYYTAFILDLHWIMFVHLFLKASNKAQNVFQYEFSVNIAYLYVSDFSAMWWFFKIYFKK